MTKICDYQNSRYRYEFWEGQGRQYEDLVERLALRALLPPNGDTLIEIGAGYGRLAPLYSGYRRVVLLDYARTQLEEAQRYLERPERHILVAADIYQLPFVDNLFDTLTMVRVMHHLVDVPKALRELWRVCRPDATNVIEYANKRNLKAIFRRLLGLQAWNPFDPQPVEFVELNFDFHPDWMRNQFRQAGFDLEAIRTVSHLRVPILKRIVPAGLLAAGDRVLQPTGRWCQLTPSVFARLRAIKPEVNAPPEPIQDIFRCPSCGGQPLKPIHEALACPSCGLHWSTQGGIFDFRTPL